MKLRAENDRKAAYNMSIADSGAGRWSHRQEISFYTTALG